MHAVHYKSSRLFSQADETPWDCDGFGGRRVAGRMFLLDLPRGLGEGGMPGGSLGTWRLGVGVGVNDGLGTASLRSDNGTRTRRTGEPRDDGLRTRGTAGSVGGKGCS